MSHQDKALTPNSMVNGTCIWRRETILAMEISRANLRGTCFSPHLKTFSDSLVTTKRNPKLPSMVLKTLGPSLQPCPQPLQSQGMAHRSPKTCKLFQILCLFLPHPHLWWTPLPHSNIMSFRKVSMSLSDRDGLQAVLWEYFVETPFTSRLYHAAVIRPPVGLLLGLQSWNKSFSSIYYVPST